MATPRILWLGLAALLAAGCSQAPVPTTHPITTQRLMQAAAHWQALAGRVGEQVVAFQRNHPDWAAVPVYIVPQTPERECLPDVPDACRAPFDQAFQRFLADDLTRRGVVVSQRRQDALSLTYETQVVTHRHPREVALPGAASMVTASGIAGAGVVDQAVRNGIESEVVMGGALAAAAVLDLWRGARVDGLPPSEVIFTTTLSYQERVMATTSDIYYINSADRGHYRAPRPMAVVVGEAGP